MKSITQFTQAGDIGSIYGGPKLERNVTIDEALKLADLNWSVGMRPLYADTSAALVVSTDENGKVSRFTQEFILPEDDEAERWLVLPNHVATYRDDTNALLGVVGSRYVPVQNRDAFGWVERFLGKDIEYITTAGHYGGGQRTFVCLDMGGFEVCPGDEVRRHLIVTNSHDGSSNLVFHIVGARLACQNMLNFAGTRKDATIKIRHTAGAGEIIDEVSKVWAKVKAGFMQIEDMFGSMAQTKISPERHNALIRHALGITDTQMEAYKASTDQSRKPRWVNELARVEEAYAEHPGHEFGEGTVWGTYNALTAYYDHYRNVRGGDPDVKLTSKLAGFDAAHKASALQFCVAECRGARVAV